MAWFWKIRRGLIVCALVMMALGGGASWSFADDSGSLLPLKEVQADEKIPSLKSTLGFHWGEDIVSHAQIERYFGELAKAAPDRTKWIPYGKSYEGRTLWLLAISSPKNISGLDAIRAELLKLSDPRKLDDDAAKTLVESLPAVVWLAYGVHGDESSSPDSALLTAYHLLADQREVTKTMLDKLIILIDPVQNPDGRDRFINAYRETRGVFPQSEPLANERGRRWIPGRFNHYWFDLNRDWFYQSQTETKAKVVQYLGWQPHIFVDAHEMGGDSTYFFNPACDPINEFIMPSQLEWSRRVGRRHSEWFDRMGFAYTTRELFDDFYPGYGSSWPTMQGGLGILWEQAGVRGLIYDRQDKTTLRFQDAVLHHYVSALATLDAASSWKNQLLRDFRAIRTDSIQVGQTGAVREYLLLEGKRPYRVERLATLLVNNGIEVERLSEPTKLDNREIPAGSYRVKTAQPTGRLVRVLLDQDVKLPEAFVKRQLDRKSRGVEEEFYDVTAWSLPLSHNVECLPLKDALKVKTEPFDPKSDQAPVKLEQPTVAYLVKPEDDGLPLALASWLSQGLRVHIMDQPFVLGGVEYGRGTLVIKVRENENPQKLHQAIETVAARFRLRVSAANTGFVDRGAHFGGPDSRWVAPVKPLLVSDRSAGHLWFLFDQEWRFPTTRVDPKDFSQIDLAKYNVLILPDSSFTSSWSPKQVQRLKDWVSHGGTLVCMGQTLEWACDSKVGLVKSRIINKIESNDDEDHDEEPQDSKPDQKPGPDSEKGKPEKPAQSGASGEKKTEESSKSKPKPKLTQTKSQAKRETSNEDESDEEPERLDRIPGTFLRAATYHDHWTTFGLEAGLPILYSGNTVIEPLKLRHGRNVVSFDKVDSLVISGFAWQDTAKRMAKTPYAVAVDLGAGHIVGFTDDPSFRAHSPALQRLLFNAIFLGPAHASSPSGHSD